MARKRKLNTRVILLLSVLGGLVVLAALTLVVAKVLPKDIQPVLQAADAAFERGDLEGLTRAEKGYSEAIRLIDKDNLLKADVYYKLAQVRWALYNRDEYIAQRIQKVQGAYQALQNALLFNNDMLAAHKLLTDILHDDPRSWSQFVKEAEIVLKHEPDNHELRFRMITCRAAMAGKDEIALVREIIKQFEDLIEAHPLPDYFITFAAFLEKVQNFGDPNDVLQVGIEHNPRSGQLAIAYARFLFQKDPRDLSGQGAAWLEKAKELAGDDADVWEALASYDFARGRYDEALESTARIKDVDVTNPRAYLIEGMIHAARRQMQSAIDTYRVGLAAMRDAVESGTVKTKNIREARARQIGKTTMYLRLGEALLDRILYDSERSLSPEQREGLMVEASGCLEQVIASAGEDSYEANSIQGRLALVKGDRIEAVRQLQAAYDKAGPQQITTALWLYEAHILNGTPGKGEKILLDFLRASSRNPQMNQQARVWLARHYLERSRDPERAAEHIDAVLKNEPNHREAQRIRKLIALYRGEELPDDVMGEMPLSVLMARVQQMFTEGKGQQAVEMIEQLYHRDKDNMPMFELLANLYLQTRQIDQALDLIADLKARRPDDEKLQEQLRLQEEILKEKDPIRQYALALQRVESRTQDPVQMNLDKARLAAQLGKRDDCEKYLNLAEEADPQDTNVIAAQFDFSISVSEFARAQTYAEKAAAADLDKCGGAKFRAILYRAQSRFEESLAAMEQVLERTPDDKPIRGAAGELYLNMGRMDKAREHFQYLAETDTTNFTGNYYMAKLTEDDPALRGTHMEYVRRCNILRPNHPDVRNWVLNLRELTGEVDAAIASRERIAKADTNDLRNYLALANLYEKSGRNSAAVEIYQDLLSRASKPLPVAERYCKFLINTDQSSQVYQVMESLIRENRVDRVEGFLAFGALLADINVVHAREAFQKAIDVAQTNQEDARPWLAMAQFLSRQGILASDPAEAMNFYKEAIGFYEKWLGLAPGAVGSDEEYRLLGLRIKVGQVELAKVRLEEILRSDGGNMKAQFALAELYRTQKDEARALEILDSAVDLNPRAIQPLMVRAAYHQELGDLPRAQADAERAWVLDPNNMVVGRELAIILMRQHKHKRAIGVLTEMLSKDRTYFAASDLLLSAYLMQKDWNNVRTQVVSARIRAMAGRETMRQVELYLIEAQMYRETSKTRESLAAMDNALLLASDDIRVLARWLDAHVTAREYDKVLRQLKDRTSEAHRPLRLYEAAALLGKGNVAGANTLLTEMVKGAKGELLVILDYISKHYKPADGLAIAHQWTSLRDEAPTAMFLGDMLRAGKDIAAAEQAYRKGLSLAATTSEKLHLHARLAQMLYDEYLLNRAQREHLTKVVESWRAVLELEPGNFAAMNNLAYIFTDELDEPAEALPYAVQAANRDPQPDVLDTLGWTKARLAATVTDKTQRSRDLVAAAGILRQAYELEEELNIVHTVTICYHLGWTYEQLGDRNQALTFYGYAKAALKDNEKDPLYAPVRDALDRMAK